jgi:superoxide reductase
MNKFGNKTMTKIKEIYKCEVCGNIVEVLHVGQGELVCCGHPMVLQQEKSEDVGVEKHVPVLVQQEGKIIVNIGEEPHPMQEDHFIEWVEIILQNGKSCRIFLNPGDEPKAEFVFNGKIVKIREYCNIHGLWINNLDKK